MKYTFKKMAGILCVILAIFILARYLPVWLWSFVVFLLGCTIVYLLYNYLYR